MKLPIYKNLTSGILCLLFSSAVLLLIPSQVSVGYSDTIYNPRFMPYFVASVIGLIGIVLVIKNRMGNDETVVFDVNQELSVAGLCAFLIALPYLNDLIGYVVVTIFTGFMILFISGSRIKKHYAIIAISVAIIFVSVEFGLKINLP